MTNNANIAIVVHDAIQRQGLLSIFRSAGFSSLQAFDSIGAVRRAVFPDEQRTVFLLDCMLLGSAPFELCAELRARRAQNLVLLIADASDDDTVLKALQCEADGLLLSDVAPDVLIKSLELTLLGERLFPASAIQRICEASILRPQACDMQDADSILSTREVEVLRHLMAGQANKVIARDCGITESTVKVHVKAILRKIQAANRTQAAVWARRHGISDSVLDVGTVQELPRREKREL